MEAHARAASSASSSRRGAPRRWHHFIFHDGPGKAARSWPASRTACMASDRFSKHCTPACSPPPLSFSLSLSFSPLVPRVYGFHCSYITYIDVTPLVCICSPDSCFPGSWALSCSASDESPRPGLQDRKGIAPEKMSWLASTSILILRRSTPRAFAPCAARMARPPLECCTMSLWLRSSTHSCLAHLQRPLQTVFSCCNQRLQDGTDALLLGALLLDATFSVQMSPA